MDWDGTKHQKKISLCRYFWAVVTSTPLLPFVLGWRKLPSSVQEHSSAAHALIIWGLLSYIVGGISGYLDPDYWWMPFGIFFGGLALLAFGFGIFTLTDTIRDRMQRESRKPHETMDMVKAFAKARKQNVCPCIDFID